jgi:hypothetical protein
MLKYRSFYGVRTKVTAPGNLRFTIKEFIPICPVCHLSLVGSCMPLRNDGQGEGVAKTWRGRPPGGIAMCQLGGASSSRNHSSPALYAQSQDPHRYFGATQSYRCPSFHSRRLDSFGEAGGRVPGLMDSRSGFDDDLSFAARSKIVPKLEK